MKKKINIIKLSKYLLILMIVQIILLSVLIANNLLISFKILPDNVLNDFNIILLLVILFVFSSLYIAIRDLSILHMMSKQSDMQHEALKNIEMLNTSLRSQRHDFLNHIQVVYSLIEMKEYNEVTNYLDKIYGSIELLNSFIKTKDVAINALLRAKSFDAKRKGIKYELNILSNLSTLNIPSWEVCRCLGNFIDNGIFETSKYLGEKKISIKIKESITDFEFTVSNTGEDIPKENLHKLFNPGFTTKNEQGEGLGLYIVKEIANKYHGNVNVISDQHLTSFVLAFPKSSTQNDI